MIFQLLLLLFIFTENSLCQYCFNGIFPYQIGGNSGTTSFTAITMDSNKNIGIGGYTDDSTVSTDVIANSKVPIVALVQSDGIFRWAKSIQLSSYVQAMIFTRDYNAQTGDQTAGFWIQTGIFQAGSYQIAADTANKIYFSWSNVSGQLKIVRISINDPSVANFERININCEPAQPQGLILFETPLSMQLITVGYLTNITTGVRYPFILNHNANTNFNLYFGKGIVNQVSNVYVSDISAYYDIGSLTEPYTMYTCVQYNNSNALFMRLKYNQMFNIQDTKAYYFGQNTDLTNCRGVYARNQNLLYAYVFYLQFSQFKFLIINYEPDTPIFTEQDLGAFNGGTNELKKSIFFDHLNSFYIADIKYINFVGKSYTQVTGALMSYHNGQSCVPSILTNTAKTAKKFEYNLIDLNVGKSVYEVQNRGTLTANTLNSLNLNLGGWCLNNLVQLVQNKQVSKDYDLYSGIKKFPIDISKTYPYCSDASYTTQTRLYYKSDVLNPDGSMLQQDYPLPSFIVFNYSDLNVHVNTDDQANVRSYYFHIQTFINQKTSQLQEYVYQINVKNPCLNASITAPVQDSIVMFRQLNGSQEYVFQNFSFGHDYCETVIQLFDPATGNVVIPSLVTYNNLTNPYKIIINTDSPSPLIYNISDGPLLFNISNTWKVFQGWDCSTFKFIWLWMKNGVHNPLPSSIQYDFVTQILTIHTDDIADEGDPLISFEFKDFVKTPNCPYQINYLASEEFKSNLPTFVSFDEQMRKFYVNTKKDSDAKSYTIRLRGFVNKPASYGYQYNGVTYFKLLVVSSKYQSTNTGPPVLDQVLQRIYMLVGTSREFNLPTITDPDNDQFTINVDLGSSYPFTTYKYPTFKFNPGSNANGTYLIKIVLADKNKIPKSSKYTLELDVLSDDLAYNFSFVGKTPTKVIKSGFSPTLLSYQQGQLGSASTSLKSIMISNFAVNILIYLLRIMLLKDILTKSSYNNENVVQNLGSLFYMLLKYDTPSDKFSSVLAIGLLILSLGFPLFIMAFLNINYKILKEKEFKDRFGSLYDQLKVDDKQALLYNVFFTKFLNRLEQFNELCILTVAYHLIIFTDYVSEDEIRDNFGTSIISITVLNIAVNMGIMLYETFLKLKVKVKEMAQKIKNFKFSRIYKKYKANFDNYDDNIISLSTKNEQFEINDTTMNISKDDTIEQLRKDLGGVKKRQNNFLVESLSPIEQLKQLEQQAIPRITKHLYVKQRKEINEIQQQAARQQVKQDLNNSDGFGSMEFKISQINNENPDLSPVEHFKRNLKVKKKKKSKKQSSNRDIQNIQHNKKASLAFRDPFKIYQGIKLQLDQLNSEGQLQTLEQQDYDNDSDEIPSLQDNNVDVLDKYLEQKNKIRQEINDDLNFRVQYIIQQRKQKEPDNHHQNN
ncbi:UNKNOWN [Stylonychia lemnae]|uniref:Cadg domain containing protein n=1 Tax=Stylonychia lemnae TaxID=5949 RepID=A0A077ZZ81_STYLE|nr:UNKNOWN [Stylonychia lemnae]|eukprot:CDW74892.1 UNKNOWN [Stylonychia lemnae]